MRKPQVHHTDPEFLYPLPPGASRGPVIGAGNAAPVQRLSAAQRSEIRRLAARGHRADQLAVRFQVPLEWIREALKEGTA